MDLFGQRLRERARQLGVSNAEAARRCGLDERRYGHYVSGRTEPDLATVVRIARTLGTTPDWLLGFSEDDAAATLRDIYLDRIMFSAQALSDRDLALLTVLAEATVRHVEEVAQDDAAEAGTGEKGGGVNPP